MPTHHLCRPYHKRALPHSMPHVTCVCPQGAQRWPGSSSPRKLGVCCIPLIPHRSSLQGPLQPGNLTL